MKQAEVIVLSDYVGGEGASTGGAGIASLASYEALRDAGASVRLITGFGDMPDADDGRAGMSLNGKDLRAGGGVQAARGVYNPASRTALAARLADVDPDRTVIIVHQWTRYLTPSAIALLRPFRVMVYMHDYFWACPNGAYFDFRQTRPCDRKPMSAACVTANCDRAGYALKLARLARHGMLDLANRAPAFRRVYLHVSTRSAAVAGPLLPNGTHVVVHNPLTPAGETPVREGDAAPIFHTGYFGRLEPEKGVRELLGALADSGMRGLFVGEGALQREVEATPGATCVPWIAHDRIAAIMHECRAIVLPSLWPETWGLVTAEAMAAGVPVLVSDRAGSAELVERLGGGQVFDPDIPGSLSSALHAIGVGRFARPLGDDGQDALRELLSPARHAAAIADAVRTAWDLDIGGVGRFEPQAAYAAVGINEPIS